MRASRSIWFPNGPLDSLDLRLLAQTPTVARERGPQMTEVTRLIEAIDSGEAGAAEDLLPLVYDELRKLAAARLAHEKPDGLR